MYIVLGWTINEMRMGEFQLPGTCVGSTLLEETALRMPPRIADFIQKCLATHWRWFDNPSR